MLARCASRAALTASTAGEEADFPYIAVMSSSRGCALPEYRVSDIVLVERRETPRQNAGTEPNDREKSLA